MHLMTDSRQTGRPEPQSHRSAVQNEEARLPAVQRQALRVGHASDAIPRGFRNGASGLRVRHDFPPLLLMIRGVVSPGPEASTDR